MFCHHHKFGELLFDAQSASVAKHWVKEIQKMSESVVSRSETWAEEHQYLEKTVPQVEQHFGARAIEVLLTSRVHAHFGNRFSASSAARLASFSRAKLTFTRDSRVNHM